MIDSDVYRRHANAFAREPIMVLEHLERHLASPTVTVLHSHPSWLPRTQTWMYNQIRFLPPSVANHVVCDFVENEREFPIANLHTLNEERKSASAMADRLLQRMRMMPAATFRTAVGREVGASIVHSHFGHVGWVDLPFVEAIGCKHVVTFYGDDVERLPRQKPWWRDRYRELFARVDAVFCEGPFMASRLQALGCHPDKLIVHHLGIDTKGFDYAPLPWCRDEPLRILIAASFREKKGIPYALQAIAQFASRRPVIVSLAGDAGRDQETQEEKKKIVEAVRAVALHAPVKMLGFRPYEELRHLAAAHHIFMQPSLETQAGDMEGGAPITLLEMAAVGCLVVATRHCDIPALVAPASHHLLAAERDVPQLVAALEWLSRNAGAWASLRMANREHIEMEFNATLQGSRLALHYARLAQSGPSANSSDAGSAADRRHVPDLAHLVASKHVQRKRVHQPPGKR